MKDATLCFLVTEGKILLGMKKRGFGKDKYNGFGGKINDDEDVEDAAIRELYEESGVKATKKYLEKVGELTFIFPYKKDWNQLVHVFVIKKWEGNPIESDEMAPAWFEHESIPFEKMWQDDKHWLPLALHGKKFEATFTFEEDNESIAGFNINKKHNF